VSSLESQTQDRAPPVAPGDVIAGKYAVERILGSGGMGVVVAAHHVHLDERVAIKFLFAELARQGGEPVARFLREGRAAAKIRSEHVARVTDVGALEGGAPYLVMEYLEGQDLQRLVEETGPLPSDDAVDYVLQACEAIAEAHSIGIVHRDLKPANLFLTRRADGSPCVKVLDFGISKMREAGARADMTKTRATLGSPLYMSPEQLVSTGDVDARADQWSLGVILFELLTACLPFEAETMPQLVAQVLQQPPRPLRALRPDVPVALDAAVARCLQKVPEARYRNIGELAAALEPVAPARAHVSVQRVARLFATRTSMPDSGGTTSAPRLSRPGSLPEVSPYAVTAHVTEAMTQTGSSLASATSVPRMRSAQRRTAAIVAGISVAVAALGAGAFFVSTRRAAAPDTSAASTAPSGTVPEGVATSTASTAPAATTAANVTPTAVSTPSEPEIAPAPTAASAAPTVPSVTKAAPANVAGGARTRAAPRGAGPSSGPPTATGRSGTSAGAGAGARPAPIPDDRQ